MKVDVWYKVPVMQEGDLDGWDGGFGGRSKREEIHIHIPLIPFVVQQKPTPHCKAIILQFLKKDIKSAWNDLYVDSTPTKAPRGTS